MNTSPLSLHSHHPRHYREHKFVYPVLSRRSQGISLGINLNPDKVCNFDCIYCQVDRRSEAETEFVELDRLLQELRETVDWFTSGRLFSEAPFSEVPPHLRRLNDFAFSGDGEPTTFKNFDELVARVASLKTELGLDQVKLVLITNASMFHRPQVERGLAVLDRHQGEIWAKLDAGTEPYYQRVERTKIPFQRILENLARAAQIRPIVIQSLFMRISGDPPPADELHAYCDRLNAILQSGGAIKLVQVYTVARPPAESCVTPLSTEELTSIATLVRTSTGLAVEFF